MPLLRTEGILLQSWDLGEHDRLVTLYTREHGRLAAVARGARRIRSRFAGALELFTWGDVVGFEREGRGLVRLDHFDIREPFRRLRDDLERLGQGARMIEAVARLTAERDAQPLCFALLLRGLRALDAGAAPARVQLGFALRLLDLLGHRPRLDRCGRCGRPVGTEGVAFDATEGSVVCGACRGAAPPLAPAVAAALRGLQTASWEARLGARLAPAVEQAAAAVLDDYLAALVGAPLRAPRFLARMRTPG
ncbi:MAG TPA: DNA repair protein RecO [Methylomirabilota bacterium]